MRKASSLALLVLAGAGFWVFFGDRSPSTRPSPNADAALKEEREFLDRLRSGGRIAFTRGGQIWVMDGDGSGQTALTRSGRHHRPSWSSDGTRVACLREDGEAARLHVLDLATRSSRKLGASAAVMDAPPRWSPDDRFIAFTRPARDDGVLHHEVRIIEVATGKELLVGGGDHPSWSSDGKLIASSLGIVDRSSPRETKPVRIPEGDEFTWSPDGNRIAFLRTIPGGAHAVALHLMDPEGNFLRRLTRHDRIDEAPVWSPDGRNLVYHSRATWDALGTDYEVAIVSAEGGEGPSFGVGMDPVWTPDGRGVIYTALRDDDAPSQIWYVDTDGRRRLNLSRSDTSDGEAQIRRR
jgi:Tol biopolymer transport system component